MRTLIVILGALLALTFTTSAAAEEETDGRMVFGGIAIGVGAAGIIAGSVVGIVAAAKYADLDCPGDVCPDALLDEADDYNDLRIPSGLTIASGALVAFVGTMFVIHAAADDRAIAAVRVGPSNLALSVPF